MRPIILDVAGYQLTATEQEYLAHPLVAGVILFTRNFDNVVQLKELVQQIRLYAKQPILIGVDHEGGRVQRFHQGFTTLPACGDLLCKADSFEETLSLAKASAFVMASELIACDIDLSFAPVLDINGISDVIKKRAFSDDKQQVIEIATAYIEGMKQAGMASTGKHFPGHGSVKADSHIALPVDARPKDAIFNEDMLPFVDLINANKLDAIMPSHVVYSECDSLPCGFSDYWLQTVLKSQLGFKGAIISDDISMHGASFVGNHLSRAEGALKAGCDFILACNDAPAAMTILDGLSVDSRDSISLINRLAADKSQLVEPLIDNNLWKQSKQMLDKFNAKI